MIFLRLLIVDYLIFDFVYAEWFKNMLFFNS
jgi:hypothetical protein